METNSCGTVFIDLGGNNSLEEIVNAIESTKQSRDEANSCLSIETKRLQCPECSRFKTDDEDKLTQHIRKVHRGENPFQCFMCDYSTYNKSLFEEHVRIHKGIKPFKCPHCPHRNVSKKNLKRHVKIHSPDNPLKCPHCDHIARHRKAFTNHANKHHPVKPDNELTCSLCSKTFQSEESMVLHTSHARTCNTNLGDQDLEPEKCGYTTCSLAAMQAHKETEHGMPRRQEKTKSGAKRALFHCGLCEWSSSKRTRILLHLVHHPDQTVDEELIDVSILRKYGIMV